MRRNQVKKHLWTSLMLLIGIGAIIASFATTAQPSQAPTLQVPSVISNNTTLLFLGNMNIAPVVYLDGATPSGVAVDIVHALAEHIPEPVEIQAMNWSEAQTLVAQGQADALIQINPTEERKKIYDFSDTLLESQFSIFTRYDKMGISGLSSLRGLRVGVESGGLPQKVLEKDPRILVTIIPNFLEGFKWLNDGFIDALVVDYRVGSYVLAENNIRNIKVTGDPIAFSYSSFAVKKGNTKLLDEINNALQIIKTDGTYQKIINQWKPTEVVFQTEQQILEEIYFVTILILLILFLFVVIWIFTIKKELTKRKSAEEKLKEQYSTLLGIINGVNALIFSVDQQYRYTSFNLGYASFTKALYGKEIELGHNLLDYITVQKDREIVKHNLDQAFAGLLFIEEVYSGEEPLSRQYFQVSHSPVRDGKEVIGVIVLAQDITERKKSEEVIRKKHEELNLTYEKLRISEEELRKKFEELQKTETQLQQSEQKFRAIIEQSFQLIGLMSIDGILLEGNNSAMKFTGIEASEALGKPFWETPWWTHSPALQEKLKSAIKKAAAGETIRFEATHPAADGHLAIIDFSIKPMFDENGNTVFLIPEGRDITNLKKAEEELLKLSAELENRVTERTIELNKTQAAYRQANEKLNLLNSITRHDITNQLTVLVGYLEILSKDITDSSILMMVKKAQIACNAILSQIAFTRDYQDIGVKSPKWQNLEAIIRQVMNVLPHENIKYETHLDNLEVYADPLLQKVVYNLVDNAIRYGEKITHIQFTYHEISEGIRIICEDDGVGIPNEDRKRLFSKGFGKNTGFGLYLSREILGITGLTIEETGVFGKGARFEITVPKEDYRFMGDETNVSGSG